MLRLPWPWLHSQSLRLRLLARVTLALGLIFTIAGASLYLIMRASLIAEFDAGLLTQASALASLTEQDPQIIKLEVEPGELPEFAAGRRPNYFEVWTPQGQSLFKSVSLARSDLTFPTGVTEHPSHRFLRLPDGKEGREVAFAFKPRFEDEKYKLTGIPQRTVVLAVAKSTHDLKDTLERLAWSLLIVSIAAIVASIAIMGLVIQRGLRPLQSLAGQIERVGADDLSERIRLDGTPRELTPVVQRLNDLLARLDSALTREKSFTADVAHELRTPLAGLETALEVCASRRREPEAYESVIGKCLRLAQGMHAMVNNLLLLARADARQLTLQSEPVDLAEFMRECWIAFEPRVIHRKLLVEWKLDVNGPVLLDKEKTRIVLNNLFDNAVTYTEEGGHIGVTALTVADRIMLILTNTGSRISSEDAAHLFDRFWRGDVARSDAGVHCGLGLSLCRKMVEVLGGTLRAESERGIFTATVSLPHKA